MNACSDWFIGSYLSMSHECCLTYYPVLLMLSGPVMLALAQAEGVPGYRL